MSQKFTAEEVRAEADFLSTYSRKPSQMLTAYAERIKADESAVTAEVVQKAVQAFATSLLQQREEGGSGHHKDMRAALLAVWPSVPAQAAQVDLRNSLLRGKAQNEEPRVRHSCNMGVGCEETGICYAEANGQPEQCGRPTAEPMAQPADSGRVIAWMREQASTMHTDNFDCDGPKQNHQLAYAIDDAADRLAALTAQGQGEPVAWRWRDSVRPGLPWYLTDSADYAKQLRQSDMYVVEDLYLAPSAPEGVA